MYWKPAKRFETASIQNDKYPAILQPAVEWLRHWGSKTNNLVVMGKVGTGKTHLAHGFLNDMAKIMRDRTGCTDERVNLNGFVFTTHKQILDDIRADWDTKDKDHYHTPALEYYATCRLLIVDEMGATYASDSDRIELLPLFNRRWEDMAPTVFLGNTLPDMTISQTLGNNLGQRIMDRVMDGALVINLDGASRRVNGEKIKPAGMPADLGGGS